MAGSVAHVNYGRLEARSLKFSNQLISVGSGDTGKECTLEFANQTTNRKLTVPQLAADQTVLHDGSSIAGDKIDINGTSGMGASAPANDDYFLIYDADGGGAGGGANKKLQYSVLKSAIDHEHTATGEGTIEVGQANGGVFAEKSMSGAITMDKDGVTTLGAAPASAGTAEASKFVQLDGSKNISGLQDVSASKFTASGDMEMAKVRIGGASAWQLEVDASGNLLFKVHTGSGYVTRHVMNKLSA
jgi:hypothetical protein